MAIGLPPIPILYEHAGETVVPMKFYQTLNQQPRSPKHGPNRRGAYASFRHSVERKDHGARGAVDAGKGKDAGAVTAWRTINITIDAATLTSVASAAVAAAVTLSDFNRAMRALAHGRRFIPVDWSWPEPSEPPKPPEPPAIPHAGIRVGELTGHRLWWVLRERGEEHLSSIAHRQLWQPGEVMNGNTREPIWVNNRTGVALWGGVYAFHHAGYLEKEISKHLAMIESERQARASGDWLRYMSNWDACQETDLFVTGTVKMWGDVIEHETGWRAEFAKVASIDEIHGGGCHGASDRRKAYILAELRRRYGADRPQYPPSIPYASYLDPNAVVYIDRAWPP